MLINSKAFIIYLISECSLYSCRPWHTNTCGPFPSPRKKKNSFNIDRFDILCFFWFKRSIDFGFFPQGFSYKKFEIGHRFRYYVQIYDIWRHWNLDQKNHFYHWRLWNVHDVIINTFKRYVLVSFRFKFMKEIWDRLLILLILRPDKR